MPLYHVVVSKRTKKAGSANHRRESCIAPGSRPHVDVAVSRSRRSAYWFLSVVVMHLRRRQRVDSPTVDISSEIRSNAVLKNAAERIEQSNHRFMRGKSAEEVIGTMKDSKMLDVKVVGEDINSRVVNIRAMTADQVFPADMVKAIVDANADYAGQKSQSKIVILEMPTMGGFYGPYWMSYVFIGALIGLFAFSVKTISGIPALLTRSLKGRAKLAGIPASESTLFSGRAILKRAP